MRGLQIEVGTQGGIDGGASAVVGYQHEFVCLGCGGGLQTEFQEYPFAGFAGTGYDVGLPSEVKAVDCGRGEEGGEGGTGKDDAEARLGAGGYEAGGGAEQGGKGESAA